MTVWRNSTENFKDNYNNQNAGCFARWATVTMMDGSIKSVCNVMRGDMIQIKRRMDDPDEKADFAAVTCVLEFNVRNAWLVTLGTGAVSTMWHPVFICENNFNNGKAAWDFPWNHGNSSRLFEGTLFNFLFDSTVQAIRVGDRFYAAYGHGIEGDPTVSHAFFGGRQIIRDLESLPSFDTGYLRFGSNPFVRDSITGFVSGFDSTLLAMKQ